MHYKHAVPTTASSDECLKDPDVVVATGWCTPTVEEGRSVSKSSTATTYCEPSCYEESEATKVVQDGSGSSVGSLVEPVDVKQFRKQLNKSLKRDGAMESVGSAGHPDSCTPCSFYCFSCLGCRLDRACTYCHLFHQSGRRKRREEWKRRQVSSWHTCEGKPQEPTQDVGEPLPKDFGEATSPDMMALRPRAPPGLSKASIQEERIQHVLPSSASCSLLPSALSTLPAAQKATLVLAEATNLCNSLLNQASTHVFEYRPSSLEVCVGEMVELWPPVSHLRGCFFVAAPSLPSGVQLDGRSGLVYGRPEEPTPGEVNYLVTAWQLEQVPPNVGVALIRLTVAGRLSCGNTDCYRFAMPSPDA
ncbi:unnamed protein product [Symbiodinium natans]|uniref:C3H1-type domain-containing protein n=1 Tax=Symbiodinium natans TaxID=878477 RepID=A0A812IAX9_9DINO|nr:unnamed protein product [Symbiodinium natans]